MKKNKISKTKEENIRIFLRFLKNKGFYQQFLKDYRSYSEMYRYTLEVNFKYKYANSGDNLRNILVRSGIMHIYDNEEYWTEVDNLWLIYIYENKLYGKNYTCSKKDLLDEIEDIVNVFFNNENTVKKAKEILKLENRIL